MKREFKDARDIGWKRAELPIGDWFARKYHVLRAYEFAGYGHAPVLEGPQVFQRRVLKNITMPDLLVFKADQGFWVEAKWKTSADFTRCTGGTMDTGIDTYLWDHYKALRRITRMEVFIMFAQEKENVVTMDSMARLGPQARDDTNHGRSNPKMWWRLDRLTHVAKLSDVLDGKFPKLPRVQGTKVISRMKKKGKQG